MLLSLSNVFVGDAMLMCKTVEFLLYCVLLIEYLVKRHMTMLGLCTHGDMKSRIIEFN